MVNIIIGADICPIGSNLPLFLSGDAQALFNDLLPELQAADLVVANLECPLTHVVTPIPKTGPCFSAPPEAIRAIQKAGLDVLCLANNHILDQGPQGVQSTIEACTSQGVDVVGAGMNLASARRWFTREIKGLKVGIMAVAEHEFAIARANRPGANPLDLIENIRDLRENRETVDYLIVLVHGSHEFHAPTPRIQKTCRFFVEMGANAVLVQHPHCLGGIEEYRGGHIVYGLGALVMDEEIYRSKRSFHEGILVKLRIDHNTSSSLEVVPFVQSYSSIGARRLPPDWETEFRSMLRTNSERLSDASAVEGDWIRFCQARKHGYTSSLLGHGRILRKLNSGGWLAKLLYRKQSMLQVRNTINCETHREAIQTILNEGLLRP